MHQQIARLFLRDAARLQVEDGLLIELANRRPVRATNIVGVNLQLGFGMDCGTLGKNEVLIGLLGVSLLRAGRTMIFPLKTAADVPLRIPLYNSWLVPWGLA
jgi:hypothetical protein